jgi:hypothetical protein
MKLALVGMFAMFCGTVFSSCVSNIKDELVSGILNEWEDVGEDLMDLLIINFNEVFEGTPDAEIDTP